VAHLKTEFQDDTDLVILLDLTKSMTVDLKALQADLLPGLEETMAGLKNFRLGFVEFRDYGEPWYTQPFALSSSPAAWIREVTNAQAIGGGDIPEAVVEALDTGLGLFDKRSKSRKVVVLFGDAPQHDSPRGKVKESDVVAKAAALGVEVHTILLPVTPF